MCMATPGRSCRRSPSSTAAMMLLANVLLLIGSGLGALFVQAHTDASLRSSEYQRQALVTLAIVYLSAAIFAAAYDLGTT